MSLTTVRSGLIENYGIGFWGPNGHDAIWHLALISQIKSFNTIINPVFAPENLIHYHLGFDIFAAGLGKLLPISMLDIYFRLLPIVFSIALGFLSIKLYSTLEFEKKGKLPLLFLIYFAGSFGWMVTLLRTHSLGGESLFWSMQSVSALLNPPYMLSLLLLVSGLILYGQKKSPLLIGLIFALSTAVKVYAGILIGLALFILVIKKKNLFNLKILAIHTLLSGLILFSYGVLNGPSLLSFQPFWFTHSLLSAYDKLYLPTLATLQANLSQNPFTYKFPFLVILEILLVIIFIIGNSGLRIFGLIKIFQNPNNDLFFLLKFITLFGAIIPIFFIQKGTAWNTIQFFYYSLFFLCFFASSIISMYSKYITYLILFFACLGSIATLKDYLGFPPPTAISLEEFEALKFIKQQPFGIVLTYPYDQFAKQKYNQTPIPIFAYESTAYVTAISGQPTFLADEVNLNILDIPFKPRLEEVKKFFFNPNQFQSRGFLINNHISYIYLTHGQSLPLSADILQIDNIFNNSQVNIFKVRK